MAEEQLERLRARLYNSYASDHAGMADAAASQHVLRHDILRHLPANRDIDVVDLGCGQGQLVNVLRNAGYGRATGIDVSPEQVDLAVRAGVQGVICGDFREMLASSAYDVVVATDFLEHFDRVEVLEVFDAVRRALRPGGRLVVRVPNSVSPFGGNYRDGDFTHLTSFTARSLTQLAAASGFSQAAFFACPPVSHGVMSACRLAVWKCASGAFKLALAAETGVLRGHLVTQNIVGVLDRPAV